MDVEIKKHIVFTKDYLNTIKQKNDIIEVASNYFNLQKNGNIYRAHCPHPGGDKTPSLVFYPNRQSFYCYSCGAGTKKSETLGSDVISLVLWMENISWEEAVKLLAKRAQIPLPNVILSKEEKSLQKMYQAVLEKNREYHRTLCSDKQVLQWFKERNIENEDLIKWKLGAKNGKPLYSICNHNGQPVAFSIREGSDSCKYINDPTSLIFKKSKILYGLHFIKHEIKSRDFLVVVEGYNDVILLQKYGVPAVGIMGTALSTDHIETITKYTRNVVLFLDGDGPGIQATINLIHILIELNINVSVINCPGLDPDDVAIRYKEKTLDFVNNNKVPYYQFIVNELLTSFNTELTKLRKTYSDKVMSLRRIIKDSYLQDVYINDIISYILKEQKNNEH